MRRYRTIEFTSGGYVRAAAQAVILLLVVMGMAGLSGCSRERERTPSPGQRATTIAVVPIPHAAPLYIAYQKGYFKDEGLKVVLRTFETGKGALDAALRGHADLATVAETPIARAAVEGKSVFVIATLSDSDRATMIIARRDRGISSPADLRGKKIGVSLGTNSEFFLYIYLTLHHVAQDEITIVDLRPAEIAGALTRGEVDAVSVWLPHTAQLRNMLGSNALALHDPDIYTMTLNLAGPREFILKNPEAINRLLRALVKATRFIRESPDEARTITARCTGLSPSVIDEAWNDFNFAVELDQSLLVSLEDQAAWLLGKKSGGTGRGVPNFLDTLYPAALEKIDPSMVTVTHR
ncbi:MAG: ABC transporter substrate-binding protein [Nitrospirota bacterium]